MTSDSLLITGARVRCTKQGGSRGGREEGRKGGREEGRKGRMRVKICIIGVGKGGKAMGV